MDGSCSRGLRIDPRSTTRDAGPAPPLGSTGFPRFDVAAWAGEAAGEHYNKTKHTKFTLSQAGTVILEIVPVRTGYGPNRIVQASRQMGATPRRSKRLKKKDWGEVVLAPIGKRAASALPLGVPFGGRVASAPPVALSFGLRQSRTSDALFGP